MLPGRRLGPLDWGLEGGGTRMARFGWNVLGLVLRLGASFYRFSFFVEGSPTKTECSKKGTLILTSLLEDQVLEPMLLGGGEVNK